MKNRDTLLIYANMNSHDGRHFIDRKNKRRMMEYRGTLFVWDANREIWLFQEDA